MEKITSPEEMAWPISKPLNIFCHANEQKGTPETGGGSWARWRLYRVHRSRCHWDVIKKVHRLMGRILCRGRSLLPGSE